HIHHKVFNTAEGISMREDFALKAVCMLAIPISDFLNKNHIQGIYTVTAFVCLGRGSEVIGSGGMLKVCPLRRITVGSVVPPAEFQRSEGLVLCCVVVIREKSECFVRRTDIHAA